MDCQSEMKRIGLQFITAFPTLGSMSREQFREYARHRTYTAGLETAAAAIGEPGTEDPLMMLTHLTLTHRLHAQLESARSMLRNMEDNPALQQEVTQLLAPISAGIVFIAENQDDPRVRKMHLHNVVAHHTQANDHTPSFIPEEIDALEAHATTHMQQQRTLFEAREPQPPPTDPTPEQTPEPEEGPDDVLSLLAQHVLAQVRDGIPTRAYEVKQALLKSGVLAPGEWEKMGGVGRTNHFTKARKELSEYFAKRGVQIIWEESGKAQGRTYAFRTDAPNTASPLIAEALDEAYDPTDTVPRNATTRELIRVLSSGEPTSILTIRDVLLQTDAIAPHRWIGHSHEVATYYMNAVVAHLNSHGIPVEYDYQGRGPTGKYWLMCTDGSALESLSSRFWSNEEEQKEDAPTHHDDRPPQSADTPDQAVAQEPSLVPAPIELPKPPPAAQTAVVPEPTPAAQYESSGVPPRTEPDEIDREKQRPPQIRRPLGDIARIILRQTRAMTNPAVFGSRRRRDVQSVIESLKLTHPNVDVEEVLNELVDNGELHIVEVDGERRVLPGSRPKAQAVRHTASIVHLQPPSFHEASRRNPVDHLQENPDIVDAVQSHIAAANGDPRAHELSAIHRAVGTELDRRDFFFLLQQMEEAGMIVRSRKGTDGPYVAHLAAQEA